MPEWFVSITGEALAPILWVAFVAVLVCGLAVLLIGLSRKATGLRALSAVRGRAPRLSVVDMARVGDRRQLVLVRRDEVEHLILIGGQNDLLVEPSIVRIPAVARARAERAGLDVAEGELAPTESQAPPSERRLPDVANILRRGRGSDVAEHEAEPVADRETPSRDGEPGAPGPAPTISAAGPEEAEAAQDLRDRMNRSQERSETDVAGATAPVEPVPAGDEGPQEKRPTSVKSFVTMIQDRQYQGRKAVARELSASQPPDGPDETLQSTKPAPSFRPQASHQARPASLESALTAKAPQGPETETPAISADGREDDAVLGPAHANDDRSRPFEAPEIDAQTTPSGESEAPDVTLSASESSASQQNVQKRRLSLEEEMRKLLGEFSAGTDDRIGRS
ncbi:hypothetical protein SAMN06297251_10389 [Fulvimarina manganoxydans]|uniref:Flagellar biosynthesis protein, FliO n=1 Tax=Fulvimarina manganoxydans TaxID=937218 RepID=A0A1W1ZSC1_9HYPH|nr:flagellar biosynthetic protein FliO [Fulvimarina manganoxydans]SMC51276.1 hypothetical protein SAMN06297251_10389 [Fulvimarina manganoxydans]